jgi:predicted PurR-regulated permease PerM
MPVEPRFHLPTSEPPTRRERWRAAVYIGTVVSLSALVILAVVFERLAAVGVLIVLFLSFVATYLMAPAVDRVRRLTATPARGRPVSRSVAVLAIYGAVTIAVLPVWSIAGTRIKAAADRVTGMVPHETAQFIDRLRASERWPEAAGLPGRLGESAGGITRHVSRSLQEEVRELGRELVGIRRLVPWLSLVPVIAFLLLTRWNRFRRSTTRILPTPHLQWRGDEFLRQVNSQLAAYTRAQVMSGVIVGLLCWIAFAILRLPYPGTLGMVAGVLEIVPLAGPIAAAVIATAMAPDRALPVLAFLAGLRLLQDYAIYPRLIRHAMHLHPVAVVVALWIGAAVGGIVGVCLAIPVVGIVQVAYRHWREYRAIETLVRDMASRNAAS